MSWGLDFVKNEGEKCIDKERQGYVCVLKVAKMVRWDGAIRIQWLVPGRTNEEFHKYIGNAASHQEEKLYVPDF